MILRTGLVRALLGLTLAGSLLAGPAVAERAPTPGASGMGDPYFPQDGIGGIDVLHYDVRDGYSFRTGRCTAGPSSMCAPPRTCRASTSTSCCRFCSLPSGSRAAIAWTDLRRPSSINPHR